MPAIRHGVGRFLCATILLTAIVVVGCANRRISVGEAESIAAEHLRDFCAYEGLSPSQFSPPKMLSRKVLGGEKRWVFQFELRGRRNAKILITVSEYGKSDIGAIGPGVDAGSRERGSGEG